MVQKQSTTKLSDYVIGYLADYGVRHIFMVTGGGAMHLNDSIGKESRIRYICNHHEQACAMAAEGYARVSGKIGVICVTTGPGGINALNGVFGAWTDSIPMLIISGQVKRETCMAFHDVPGLRQLGDQEADIISMVKGITKYAVLVREPESIRYHLEKALHLSTTGRPGPCWIDIPLDVQGAQIDETKLASFEDQLEGSSQETDIDLGQTCDSIIERLVNSERPVIIVGTGIRLAGAVDTFLNLAEEMGIPICTAWAAHDIVPDEHKLYAGRPGTVGDRPGNFAVQSSDCLLILGCRLNIRQVSYNWNSFARHAYKIQVDIDNAELNKPTVQIDMKILADLKDFLPIFHHRLIRSSWDASKFVPWINWCRERVRRYPVYDGRENSSTKHLNPYFFFFKLFSMLTMNDTVVCGNGSACVIPFQVGVITRGLRMFCNSGCASMGYDLPASMGACLADTSRRTICLAGDGSFMMNIQELQTVKNYGIPLKIFILNNQGYSSIRQTQINFFSRLVGEGPQSGVTFPDFVKLAQAYGINAIKMATDKIDQIFEYVLNTNVPVLCDVPLNPETNFAPKLSSKILADGSIVSPELDDMYPFLDETELMDNRII